MHSAARLLYGPALLLLWQTAPVAVQRDSATGRVYLGFGADAGNVEARELNCAGDVVSSKQVPYGSAGGSLEYWPSNRWRLSGAAGGLVVNHLPAEGFATAVAAWEGSRVGLGAGVGYLSYPEIPLPPMPADSDPNPHADGKRLVVPAIYLRLGGREDLHVQAELMPATETPSSTGYIRLGIGDAAIGSRGISVLTGATAGPYANGKHEFRWFGDVMVPVQDHFDLGVRLMFGNGHLETTSGVGLVGRIRWDTH